MSIVGVLCVAFAALCVVTNATTVSKFKWSQDKNNIYLAADAPGCKSPTLDFGNGHDQLTISCPSSKDPNQVYELDLTFWDDIAGARCQSSRKGFTCTVGKTHTIRFDRLLYDPTAHRTIMSVDWEKSEFDDSPDDDDEASFEDSYAKAPVIQISTEAEIEELQETHNLVVLDVSLPWCSKCNHIRSKIATAAKAFQKKKTLKGGVAFGYVDALESRELRHRFNPDCDYICYLHIVKKGEIDHRIEANDDEEKITRAISAHIRPLLTPISTAAELKELQQELGTEAGKPNSVLVLGLFDKETPEHVKQLQEFEKAAVKMRGTTLFVVASPSADLGWFPQEKDQVNTAAMVIVRRNNQKSYLPREDFGKTNLSQYITISRFDLLSDYSWEVQNEFGEIGLPVGQVFVDKDSPDSSKSLEMFSSLAKEFHGRLMFLQNPASSSYMLAKYGLGGASYPAFSIVADIREDDGIFYPFTSGDLNLDNLKQFCEDVLAGKVPGTRKSEEVPEGGQVFTPGKVLPLAWLSLNKLVLSDEEPSSAFLIIIYKTWMTGWERQKAAIWDKIARYLEPIPSVKVAKYDAETNHVDQAFGLTGDLNELQVLLFPSHAARTPILYSGKISSKFVLNFVKKHVSEVKSNWKAVLDMQKVLKAEAEAAKAAKEAKIAARQAELASLEKIDISGDGGVIKQVMEEGSGEIPSVGAKVKAHYTGTLLDGTQFDSSRDRGSPFDFTLGQGQVIKCWDQAFASMRVGEKALLTCTADYAYGERGSGSIPANADLQFDVELISFDGDAKEEEGGQGEEFWSEGTGSREEL
eukprot:m.37114 g.37114  ORF g.37114 m.37114 type:complete len:810 (+) comp16174_c0_seq2:15-2444(+)